MTSKQNLPGNAKVIFFSWVRLKLCKQIKHFKIAIIISIVIDSKIRNMSEFNFVLLSNCLELKFSMVIYGHFDSPLFNHKINARN
jgi:hypothetical protein